MLSEIEFHKIPAIWYQRYKLNFLDLTYISIMWSFHLMSLMLTPSSTTRLSKFSSSWCCGPRFWALVAKKSFSSSSSSSSQSYSFLEKKDLVLPLEISYPSSSCEFYFFSLAWKPGSIPSKSLSTEIRSTLLISLWDS